MCGAVTVLAGAAVKRLPIAQLGVRYKGKQKIEITRDMLSQVVANFRKRDTGEVPIDYDHAIEVSAGSGGPTPAAGWIRSIDDAPDREGTLWGDVEWTPRAAQMIAAKEYKYISPVIDPTVRDNKTGEAQGWTLTSAALTNQPVLQGMPALVLSEAGRNYSETEVKQVSQDVMDAISVEVNERVKQLMSEKGLQYGAALQLLMTNDRELFRRYSAAKGRYLGNTAVSYVPGGLASQIHDLAKQKMAASEGRIDYAAAFKAVLSERPDIERQYKEAIR